MTKLRSDQMLLNDILDSNAPIHEKAAAELMVREQRAHRKQTWLLLVLTVVASVSTLIQAVPVIKRLLSDIRVTECQCCVAMIPAPASPK